MNLRIEHGKPPTREQAIRLLEPAIRQILTTHYPQWRQAFYVSRNRDACSDPDDFLSCGPLKTETKIFQVLSADEAYGQLYPTDPYERQ